MLVFNYGFHVFRLSFLDFMKMDFGFYLLICFSCFYLFSFHPVISLSLFFKCDNTKNACECVGILF